MSLAASFRVDVRPYSGYDDPALPVAAWIAEGGLAGDASGGVLTMNFLFQRDEDAQISELFNLEQIAADTISATAREFTMETLNMDSLSQNRPATDRIWRLSTDAVANVAVSALALNLTELPIWLGAPNRGEGDAGLRFNWTNIDLLLYFITIQGYMWGPRSVLAQGGPNRPISGLFGQ